jgi:hypothetical protein
VQLAGIQVVGGSVAPPKPPFAPLIPPASAPAAAPSPDDSGAVSLPDFVPPFDVLKTQLGPTMGSAIEPVESEADTCDTQQRTSTGLAYWRCSTNVVAFAADPDGLLHWAWVNNVLVSWAGDSPDPPPDALVVAPSSAGDGSADGHLCVLPNTSEVTACPISDGMAVPGFIQASGQTNAYRFEIGSQMMSVTADLTSLPADYDLYLADATGAILGQSVNEGTTPEEIQSMLGTGTYYLFVHSDPARAFDPEDPYTLQLTVLAPDAQPNGAGTGGADQT